LTSLATGSHHGDPNKEAILMTKRTGKGSKGKGGAEHPSKSSLTRASKAMSDPYASKTLKSLAAVVLGEGRKKK
jgi:hypothetical protein